MDAFVSILKQETDGTIPFMKIIGIDLEYSLHEFGKINGPNSLKEKVKMIGHKAIMKYLDLVLF